MSSDPSGMPKSGECSTVEDAYFQSWGKVGGVGRLRRTFSLFAEFWRMIEFQIRKEHPGICDREVRRHTAKRMYLSDDAARRLLDRTGGQVMEQPDLQET